MSAYLSWKSSKQPSLAFQHGGSQWRAEQAPAYQCSVALTTFAPLKEYSRCSRCNRRCCRGEGSSENISAAQARLQPCCSWLRQDIYSDIFSFKAIDRLPSSHFTSAVLLKQPLIRIHSLNYSLAHLYFLSHLQPTPNTFHHLYNPSSLQFITLAIHILFN